jgi:hypothetical protein
VHRTYDYCKVRGFQGTFGSQNGAPVACRIHRFERASSQYHNFQSSLFKASALVHLQLVFFASTLKKFVFFCFFLNFYLWRMALLRREELIYSQIKPKHFSIEKSRAFLSLKMFYLVFSNLFFGRLGLLFSKFCVDFVWKFFSGSHSVSGLALFRWILHNTYLEEFQAFSKSWTLQFLNLGSS